MRNQLLDKYGIKYIIIIALIAISILAYSFFDINLVSKLFEETQNQIGNRRSYILFLIFLLRSFSIVIPLLPGTYCAVIAGYVYGIKGGMVIMFMADLISCSIAFFISRNFGRGVVKKLLGIRQMQKIESISQKYLENNFFLMTGFLMTSWFDFVCYSVGLTKLSWKKFMPALILSILISDLPFVAGGHTLSQLRNVNIKDILNGQVNVIQGPYLFILILSALIIFGLGMLNPLLHKGNK